MRKAKVIILIFVLSQCFTSFGQGADFSKLPTDLLHVRTDLPPELNAATEWKAAESLFVPIPEDIRTSIIKSWSLDGKKLDSAENDSIRKWVEANSGALTQVDKSLQKDRAQIAAWNILRPMPYATTMFNLTKARLFLADEAISRGDHTNARRLFVGNLKLSRLLRDAEAPMIHYLIACSMRSMTEKAISRWLNISNPDAEMIKQMLADLPELVEEADAYERVIRVEFTDCIPFQLDVKRLTEFWVESARTNEFILQMQPEELQRPMMIVHDPKLLNLHSRPFDREKQIHFYESRFRLYAANARSAWNKRDDSSATETARIHERFLADIEPLLKATKNAKLPLSSYAVRRAAQYYVKLENPVGRFWQSMDDSLARTHNRVFQARTERAVTRTILAIRLYGIINGKPPLRLEDLVAAGLLQTIPVDEFSGAPLHYSSEKRILWSVGENGTDDGGTSGTNFWKEKDAVWTLAPL